jgi:hypothetical protein
MISFGFTHPPAQPEEVDGVISLNVKKSSLLTLLSVQETFIEFGCRESFKTYL